MTQTSVRWTHVLFGVGLTLVVAIAPMLFVLMSGISAQGHEQHAAAGGQSALLLAGGSKLPAQNVMLVLVAALAVAAVFVTIVVSTRAERER